MKNIFFTFMIAITFINCSNNTNYDIANYNPRNLHDLGLTPENNKFPYYPFTATLGLGDNMWFHIIKGDTLTVYRRDNVSDDSGDDLKYTFLIKHCTRIQPLKVKRTVTEGGTNPPINYVAYNKLIDNFKLQGYEEKKYLACQIETLETYLFQPRVLKDRMWIDLSK